MQGVCYIIGAGDVKSLDICKNNSDFVICADGGFEYAKKFGLKCDLLVGDFDSISHLPQNENIKKYPCEKDETDMMIAAMCGLEKGYKNFVIFGALGGSRFEHTVANIQLLSFLTEKGARGVILDDDTVVSLIQNEKVIFSEKHIGYISVFSVSDKSENVSIKGLKYEVENAELTNSFALGVSNEFIGKKSEIEVKNGRLLLVFKGEYNHLLK